MTDIDFSLFQLKGLKLYIEQLLGKEDSDDSTDEHIQKMLPQVCKIHT